MKQCRCTWVAAGLPLPSTGNHEPAAALIWAGELNGKILLSYYISGFPLDCVHAAATWIFLWFSAGPMLEKLDRIKVKYGLVE